MKLQLVLALVFNLVATTNAFGSFNFGAKKAAPKSSIPQEILDEALEIYDKAYPTRSGEGIKPFWNSWGLPKRDIDGSSVMTDVKNPKKKLFDVVESERVKTFSTIATLYGTDEALTMLKAMPSILAFDNTNFAPALTEFSTIFGEDEAKAMVMRNPGLLYVKPEGAATSDDLTMQFSYIIGFTRPVGPVLLYGTLSLLMVPVLEGITGVSRAAFLSSIGF